MDLSLLEFLPFEQRVGIVRSTLRDLAGQRFKLELLMKMNRLAPKDDHPEGGTFEYRLSRLDVAFEEIQREFPDEFARAQSDLVPEPD